MIRPMSEYGQFVHDAFQSRNTQRMNQSPFERKRPTRLARPPPAIAANRRCGGCQETGGKAGNGAQLRLDKRVAPPTFAIASPGSSEGEAMAKAGGRRRSVFDS